jgi:Family of unknown function (DUF6252)
MKMTLMSLLAVFVLFLSSCSDDNDGGSNDPSSLSIGTIKATVDGASWSSGNAIGVKVQDINYTVSGANLSMESISLTVSAGEVGSIFTGQGFFQIFDVLNPTNIQSWSSNAVEYKITKFENDEIEGTFSFTGTNETDQSTKKITNGIFKVKIQNP